MIVRLRNNKEYISVTIYNSFSNLAKFSNDNSRVADSTCSLINAAELLYYNN
jgi:hypothetical protein